MIPTGTIGDITWHRIIEAEGPEFEIGFLLPDATPETIAPYRDWMEPDFLEPGTNKLIMATQMMGDTSTPPTGGTRLLVGLSRGSVGRYAMTHGILDTGTDGYQVITMRMMNSRVDTENTGPRIPAISFAWSGFKGSSATPRSQSA